MVWVLVSPMIRPLEIPTLGPMVVKYVLVFVLRLRLGLIQVFSFKSFGGFRIGPTLFFYPY